MGFFKKLKSLKNAITGGAAKVTLETNGITFGESFEIVVKVQVENDDVKIKKAYLTIQGREVIEIPDTAASYDGENYQDEGIERVMADSVTTKIDVTIAEEQVLKAHENYQWIASVKLPDDAIGIYKGKYCEHSYVACASLDCFGNDPDSGWQELKVV